MFSWVANSEHNYGLPSQPAAALQRKRGQGAGTRLVRRTVIIWMRMLSREEELLVIESLALRRPVPFGRTVLPRWQCLGS
jgi:hypothetical protein